MAGGYWMHLTGRTDPLTITGAEIGAFVDGPEIWGLCRIVPNKPDAGQP